ncbi:MAG: hypothetical protein QW103_02045 [Candidatus Pacearchaeota archaeon]
MVIEGYSVKAKKKVFIKDPVIEKTEKGVYMAKGKCPETGVVVCVMLSEQKALEAIKKGEAKKGF